MTMRISKDRIDLDNKVLQKPVLKDYGETVVTMAVSGSGYHLSFDGDNDYVELPAAPTPTSVLTLVAWVSYATGSESGRILDKGDLGSDPDGGVEWRPNGLDSNNHGGVSPDSLPPANQWVHLAVTFDSGTTRFYEDGAFVSEESAPFSTFNSGLTDDIWKIGRRANDNTADFTGKIDDVRMFSRVLSDGEIADIYEGTSVSDTNLEGWWKFDEGSGVTVSDSSSNGRDGTRNGATWVSGDAQSTNFILDLTDGNVFDITLEANAALIFANPPVSGTAGSFTLYLTQDATGGRTVTWPSAVKWAGGSAPTLFTDEDSINILNFFTLDRGATWYGSNAGGIEETNPSLSFIENVGDASDSTIYTFSNTNIGAAAADRLLIVSVHWESTASPPDVTIAGVPAVEFASAETDADVAMYYLTVTNSTTADIVVDFGLGSTTRCGIGIWRLTGHNSNVPEDFDIDAGSGTGRLATLNVPQNGVVVAAQSLATEDITTAWTGVTEHFDERVDNDWLMYSGGSALISVDDASYNITTTHSNSDSTLVAAVWR